MAKPSSAKTRRRTNKVRRTQSRRGGGPKRTNSSYWEAYIAPYLPPTSRSRSSVADIRDLGGLAGHHHAAMKGLNKELINMEVGLERTGLLTDDEIKARVDAHNARKLPFIDKWNPNPHRSMLSMFSAPISSVIGKLKSKKPSELVYVPAEFKNNDIWTEITNGMSPDGISALDRIRHDASIERIKKTPSGVWVIYNRTHPIHGRIMNMFIPS